jgi:hypothetical protein
MFGIGHWELLAVLVVGGVLCGAPVIALVVVVSLASSRRPPDDRQ